ncbi:hypothetical protein O185_23035 [Photorhabdus temperata J3]|uniref:Uncharacterized protein n=1 Tax=Photorhabdus temperata J3 TaxID=1389415 RepID=U7QRZ9_PHOTE|nr:hypothetical protein O185_23035 [Photorhabdus temperata J3]
MDPCSIVIDKSSIAIMLPYLLLRCEHFIIDIILISLSLFISVDFIDYLHKLLDILKRLKSSVTLRKRLINIMNFKVLLGDNFDPQNLRTTPLLYVCSPFICDVATH